MASRIDDLLWLYAVHGGRFYGGERVTQLEHALQCAHLAEQAGAPEQLVLAALLHDVGHLIGVGYGPHEEIGARHLYGLFSEAVIEPIRLHVSAKRYLCYSEPGYWDSLSPESKRSLERQGGAFTSSAASYFLAKPYAQQAIALRRWDDLAKRPGEPTPDLAHYLSMLKPIAAPSPI